MGEGNWFRRSRRLAQDRSQADGKAKRRDAMRSRRGRGLYVESLEDRRMLAVYTVVNLDDTFINDDGDVETTEGSLRDAIEQSNDSEDENDFIVFAPGLSGTIFLNNDQIEITDDVQIIGPSNQLITVQADANSRHFFIDDGDDDESIGVQISGMTLQGGAIVTGDFDEQLGGSIWNKESLRMVEAVLANNTAGNGGGAIYVEVGNLSMTRSYVTGNSAGGERGGGGILFGTDEDDPDNRPSGTILNSTISQNEASGGDGGGIFNRSGREVNIFNSTIVYNTGNFGAGVASWGNPIAMNPDDDPPDPVIFTNIHSSIFALNTPTGEEDELLGAPGDIDVVGTGEQEGPDGAEEMRLADSVVSTGFNIILLTNIDPMVFAPTDQLDTDPMLTEDPDDFGGSTPVYLPLPGSPAIDLGDGEEVPINAYFDQRGRHFTREFGDGVDVGAAELQEAQFVVDLIADETDLMYSQPSISNDPYLFGDFSLREALLFSELNPLVDTITFLDFREDPSNPDPTPSPAPTIRLTLGELRVFSSVFILGPTYLLEVDASGNDPTPLINNADGSRVFRISDGLNSFASDVTISSLALIGGDTVGRGGGILNQENLTLSQVTLRDHFASDDGGGLLHQLGTLTIDGTTISGNRSGDDGAGLFIDSSIGPATATITNATISGNVAGDRGAGIVNNGSSVRIEYSTITANNSASTFASGMANFGADAETTVYSTIISGNVNRDVEAFAGAQPATFISEGYNFIGSGNSAGRFLETGDKSGTNPMLAPLAVTGGMVATHRPVVGSPVLDAGDPAAMAGDGGVPATDQRGGTFTRVFDGDMDGTPRIDIGSYEVQPTILIVDTAGDANDGDFSPGNFSLREAIELSNQNPLVDTIMFDPLLSVITTGGNNADTLTIRDSVKIVGPGSGDLAVQASPVAANALILADNIFTIDDGTAGFITVEISGLELRNAQIGAIKSRENLVIDDVTFINNRSTTAGGAISHQLGSVTMKNSLVTGNSTTVSGAGGGALYFFNVNGNSKLVFDYVTISGNSTSQTASNGGGVLLKNSVFEGRAVTISGNSTLGGASDAGGLFVDNSSVLFEESTISGNATVGANSEGGGMFVSGANSVVTLTKSSVLALNVTIGSQSRGAGAYVTAGVLNIDNAAVVQNRTTGLDSSGGGIAIAGGTVNVTGSSFQENTVVGINSHGGGIANLGGNLLVRSSTMVGNSAQFVVAEGGGRGGAIYSDTNLAGQTTSIVNSTISGNSAPYRGGGVFNADGRTEILHSTITNNSTPFFNAGNGVGSQASESTLTVIGSSIIAGNVGAVSGLGSDVDSVGFASNTTFQSLGYNVVGTGNSANVFVQAGDKTGITNPLLGPLLNNGGLTDTHAVLANSPAINAGSPAFNPASFTPALNADQRGPGFPRVLGGRIDAGAFESAFSPLTADFDSDGDVDSNDFMLWQRNVGKATGATKAQGDANGDGAVNDVDLAAWRSQFGATLSEPAVAPAVVSDEAAAATSVATIHFAVMDAKDALPASTAAVKVEAANLAGSGTPRVSAAGRPTYRPAARHQNVAIDAAYATAVGYAPALAASLVGTGAALESDDADDESGDSWSDEAFAMLGEGVL
jgi:predicted outer membrane repeat protein